ncbi:MAG: C-type lectin domain-containing protein [Kofleriaceae bacterium]|nr:C-type lectin domain-containing protein [Kofleriaceae bacterium]
MKALILTAVLAGCGAELGQNEPGVDAFRPGDAGGDANGTADGPVDARPCTGGDARAVDPTTGSCFVYFTGPLTYVEAAAQCTAMTSQLAVIKSAQTNATLETLIGLTDAFVGADDRTLEGTYRWLGSATDPVSGAYTNWRTGEPNNGGGGGVEEDCMIIEGDQGGTWDDRPCDQTQVSVAGRYAYICQYN